jgi:hypothetical protein
VKQTHGPKPFVEADRFRCAHGKRFFNGVSHLGFTQSCDLFEFLGRHWHDRES